ncbi:winged helix-turn-helix domain-containing protein [Streptomyces sp. NPDC088785]|uniref:winged helix-turn-helix domain-containing protein n=1 Tax=Streptomyces sp. NPDC088785 TaxID=3365897 RepID=UPI003821C248
MSISRRLEAAAQAIDEQWSDQAEAAGRYEQFMSSLSIRKPDDGASDSSASDSPRPVSAIAAIAPDAPPLGQGGPVEIRNGDLSVDEATYSAKLKGRVLELTFKEFELLKYLAQHPGRVFTRAQLLQEVWGYDYFGGARTVDVHVRRLRAKLGPEDESLIGTVRNAGYRFVPPEEVMTVQRHVEATATAEADELIPGPAAWAET